MQVKQELVLYAPRRSGHHAIISSYISASKRPVVFVNDGDPRTSPFDPDKSSRTGLSWRKFIHNRLRKHAFQVARRLPINVALVHNYEDFEEWADGPLRNSVSSNACHVIVARDPFNLLASRLRWHRTVHSNFGELSDEEIAGRMHTAIKLMQGLLSMARLHRLFVFNYDDWLHPNADPFMHGKKLGLCSPLVQPREIAKYGPGSSFVGQSNHDARKLDFLNRWREFQDDEVFRTIALTSETIEIAEQYFPESTGLAWAQTQ